MSCCCFVDDDDDNNHNNNGDTGADADAEDDDLSIGSPHDEPNEEFLNALDLSGRDYEPHSNYQPISVQRKTLMDEEGHGGEGRGRERGVEVEAADDDLKSVADDSYDGPNADYLAKQDSNSDMYYELSTVRYSYFIDAPCVFVTTNVFCILYSHSSEWYMYYTAV